MKTLKVYGVKGLMEWQCVIYAGNVRFHFAFSEGTITGYGVTPAKYTTSNPILQKVIENSEFFKNGKIFIVKQFDLEPAPVAPVSKEDLTIVEVSCLDDAKDYLADHFNISRLKLKSKSAIIAQAEENNIEFRGI